MNIHFKPFYILLFIVVVSSATFSYLSALLFMPNGYFYTVSAQQKVNDIEGSFATKFALEQKQQKVETKTQTVKTSYARLLLKDFSLSAIFYDGSFGEVIARDPKGGVFLLVGDSHKGYTLEKVFVDHAVFKKNGDEYYAFLSPEDEKNFNETQSTTQTTTTQVQSVRDTVARAMFEDVKFKDGTYYIPKDLLLSYKNLGKIFSSIGVQGYNLNGDIKFKVVRVARGSVFDKIGLKRGDFIHKIDGSEFKSVSEPIKYFQNLENIQSLSLTIQRGNETKELNYEVY